MNLSTGISFLVFFMMISCKPANQSQIQSLENLAAGNDIRTNSCESDPYGRKSNPSYFTEQDIADSDSVSTALKDRALLASKALPADLRSKFKSFDGKIRITPKAEELCTSFLGGSSAAILINYGKPVKLDSCAVVLSDSESGQQSFEVILPADSKIIGHQLVRQFGFVAAQIFSRLGIGRNESGEKIYFLDKSKAPDLIEAKLKLASAYLHDLNNSTLFRLDGAQAYLGKNLFGIAKSNLQKNSKGSFGGVFKGYLPSEMTTDLMAQNSRYYGLLAFSDHVFGEAFDSFYCKRTGKYQDSSIQKMLDHDVSKTQAERLMAEQENSYLVMYDLFPRTFQAFRNIDDIINPGGTVAIPDRAPLKPTQKSGAKTFSLTAEQSSAYPGGWWNPGNWRRGLYTGDARAPDSTYSAAKEAAGQSFAGNIGTANTGLDAFGIVDPTGAADVVNAAAYASMGDNTNAAISMAGVIPFVGDVAKGPRLAKRALKYSDDAAELVLRQGDTVVDSANAGIRQAKRDVGIPTGQQPYKVESVPMTSNGKTVMDKSTNQPVMTKEYSYNKPGVQNDTVVIQNHSAGHTHFTPGDAATKPHINAREGSGSGRTAPGASDHYVIQPPGG